MKFLSRSSKKESSDGLRIEVIRILDHPADYVPDAAPDTGEALRDVWVVYPKPEQPSTLPVLHLKWQDEDIIHNLNYREQAALEDAGFPITEDPYGHYLFWRKYAPSDLWLMVTEREDLEVSDPAKIAWSYSKASSLSKTKPKTLVPLGEPELPIFEGFPTTPHSIVRESMTSLMCALTFQKLIPEFMLTREFYVGLKVIAENLVDYLDKNPEAVNEILHRHGFVSKKEAL